VLRTPEEVAAMLELRRRGWGIKRIAGELGCNPRTVRRYVEQGEWRGYDRRCRGGRLDGLQDWLAERFRQHRGNADVVRQDLLREHGIVVSLRTVERAVAPLRRELRAETLATVRFETPPGKQLQIDFGERRTWIAGESTKVFLFVATLGYARRTYVQAFRHERQSAWFAGLEAAFRYFGGVPQEVLFDNARALVTHHDAASREITFNDRLHAFARHWAFRPQACAPYRARTKGKDERGVGYVKANALAGHRFVSWPAFEAHLAWWMREVADVRTHGTTGEAPIARFERAEAAALRSLDDRPSFQRVRELVRKVQNDCCVEVDENAYSVPWRLIGERVRVLVAGGRVTVEHGHRTVASHSEHPGRRHRSIDPRHLDGIVGAPRPTPAPMVAEPPLPEIPEGELLRPLAEYEALVGGGW
jgi:transposase